MKNLNQIFFNSRESFRKWLENNYNTSQGIWMIFYKKHTNIKSIKYNEALEEALCFGWIDSIIKRIDDDIYERKFTPRTNITKWSEVNRRLVNELIRKGRMTEAGLEKFGVEKMADEECRKEKDLAKKSVIEFDIPDFILREFGENEPALKNFNNLAVSQRRNYILWITTARKEETIKKRLKEAVALLKENQKLGLK